MKLDVILIHPPTNFSMPREAISALPSYHIGYGMLHIASTLLASGFKVSVWNLEEAFHLDGITSRKFSEIIEGVDCKIVGIELNWLHFSKGAIQTAKIIKKIRPDITIIVGGTHATLFADQIVRGYHKIIDAVLKGEAEKTFLQLARKFEEKDSLSDVDVGGLVTFKDGRVIERPLKKEDIFENIDEIPPFTYRVVRRVKDGGESRRLFAGSAVNTCRGPCPYECLYCIDRNISILSGRREYAVHSPEWIVNQINLLLEEGCYEFAFQDNLYLSGKKYLRELSKTLIREKISDKINGFNMISVPGFLDSETLEELSKAGCTNIDYGVESGSEHVLKLVRRPTSINKIIDSIKDTIQAGIIPFTWWMTGLPNEGKEEIKETLKLIMKTSYLGAIPKWITPLILLPHTELFEKAEEFGVKPKFKSFKDFMIFSNLTRKRVSFYPEAITHETNKMSRENIAKASIYLKTEIFKRKNGILSNFKRKFLKTVLKYHPSFNEAYLMNVLEAVLSRQLESFF
ncbi:MAG: radical SAM protein [Candidatus Bathyarchaeia archaeon]